MVAEFELLRKSGDPVWEWGAVLWVFTQQSVWQDRGVVVIGWHLSTRCFDRVVGKASLRLGEGLFCPKEGWTTAEAKQWQTDYLPLDITKTYHQGHVVMKHHVHFDCLQTSTHAHTKDKYTQRDKRRKLTSTERPSSALSNPQHQDQFPTNSSAPHSAGQGGPGRSRKLKMLDDIVFFVTLIKPKC